MISGYTPWWIFVHPESADFQVGYSPNLEVWMWFSKKHKTLQKLRKCWHPEVKLSSFIFLIFFHVFFGVLELEKLPRRSWWNSQEMARLKKSLLRMLWRTRRPGFGVTSCWRLYPFSWEIISLLFSPDRHQIFLRKEVISDLKVSPKWSADVFLGKLQVDGLDKKYVQKSSQSKSSLSAGSPEKSVQHCELLELKDRFRHSMI